MTTVTIAVSGERVKIIFYINIKALVIVTFSPQDGPQLFFTIQYGVLENIPFSETYIPS